MKLTVPLRYGPAAAGILLAATLTGHAQTVPDAPPAPADSAITGQGSEQTLGAATVAGRRKAVARLQGAENGFRLDRQELFKAACCNLGESFTTNPSVDVNYSDAATGARQIKLLGLAGTYVQMLHENIPSYRGAAAPFALGYVPGPWMQAISVSKGSASVKNGYESITGQIDVEYKKPQAEPSLEVNLFGDTSSRIETNFDGNIHLGDKLSTGLLLHYEDELKSHDGNGDGFLDRPKVRQYHAMNRWAWVSDRIIFQAAASALKEEREGGQSKHAAHRDTPLYRIGIDTERYEGFVKNAFIIDPTHQTNIALMLSGSYHKADAAYGLRLYDVRQRNGYASLLFETQFTPRHNLSAGLSVNHDYYNQRYRLTSEATLAPATDVERETVPGAYVQYTYSLDDKLTLMGGLRADHSSLYGTFVTPRFHLKYSPWHALSLRLSAGKGYRTVHALAENHNLLATGRRLVVERLPQEAAWNYGISANLKIPLGRHVLEVNAEYYYTRFSRQTVVDMDSDPGEIRIAPLHGKSYSHTFQVDASYPVAKGMTLTAAWRWNDVRAAYGGRLREKPLTSKYKALLTASWKSNLELWQADITAQLNGGGRLPAHFADATSATPAGGRYKAFAQLNAQVTRWFRHWSIYAGGENLTNFRQKHPIVLSSNPWSERFDAVTQAWGPTMGAMGYVGARIHF